MPPMSRVAVPGLLHHATQRGVRSIPVFDGDEDRELHVSVLRAPADRRGVRFHSPWAFCWP